MPKFGTISKRRLASCHEDLQRVANEVIKHIDCTVVCGHRDEKAQNDAFRNRLSKARWGESKHNAVNEAGEPESRAMDLMPYHDSLPHIQWKNTQEITEFANFVLGVAAGLGVKLKWGGRFKNFFDGPHYELM